MKKLTNGGAISGLAVGICAMVWALSLAYPHVTARASFLDAFENRSLNWRMASFGIATPPASVVIVAIDDATLNTANPLGPGRPVMARLVDQIAKAQPRVVALDILLTGAASPEGDPALARALSALPAVIAAAGSPSPPSLQNIPAVTDMIWPFDAFADQAEIGIANISTDSGGIPRHIPIVLSTSQGLHPSFAAMTAALFTQSQLDLSDETVTLGGRTMVLEQGYHMPLRLLGPQGSVPTISALDVLSGAAADRLTDKAVVIGVTASGLGDRFPTPFDPSLPGVEVMATAIHQLISGNVLRRDIRIRQMDVLAVGILAPLCALLVLFLPLVVGVPLAAGALGLWLGVAWAAFDMGFWLSLALPVVAVGPPATLSALFRYRRERRAAAVSGRAVTELKRFQSPLFADQIAADPDFLRAPEERDLIICFIDLSGFTQFAQDLGAKDAEAFLKRFHQRLAGAVHDRDGAILNFMGDGALVVYGLKKLVPGTAGQALEAAFEIAANTLSLGRESGLQRPLTCRIGLHRGAVFLSRLGDDRHQQLTVSGDGVNLASRLLEIAKTHAATVVSTEAFQTSLGDIRAAPPSWSDILPIRGREGSVSLHFWRL